MRFERRRLLNRVAAIATFAFAVCLIGAHPFTQGMSFRVRMVMNMPPMPGMGGGDMIIVGHGVAVNGKSRLDIDSGGGNQMAPFGPGDYLLTLDSGRTVIVSPATKTYLDGFVLGGGLPPELMAQASLTGVTVNLEKLGAGDTVEGRPTQKYKVTSQYTLNIMGNSIGFGGESEILTADLPTKISTALGGGLPKAMETGPFSEYYAKMLGAQKQMSGTAVKVNNIISINGPMSMNLSQTMQVLDVKSTDVDDKQFEIPAGFTARPPGL